MYIVLGKASDLKKRLAGPGPDPVRPQGPVHSPTRTWTYEIGSGPPSHWPGPSDLWGRSGPDTGPRGPGPTLGQSNGATVVQYFTLSHTFHVKPCGMEGIQVEWAGMVGIW